MIPADTDVFKTSSRRLGKVTTFYDHTRHCQDVWKKTSALRRLEDVQSTTSWRRLIYVVLKASNLWRLEDVWFTTSSGRFVYDVLWRSLIYDVFRVSDLRRLEDVWFMSSWRRPVYDVLKRSDLGRLEDVCKTTFV